MKKGKEKLVWIALFLLSFFFYPFAIRSSWVSNSDIHSLLEFSAATFALVTASIILILFFATGRHIFLLLSLGFTLQGAEDFIHAVYSFVRIWPTEQMGLVSFVPGTYVAGRLILIIFTIIGLALAKISPVQKENRIKRAIKYNVLGFILSAVLTFLIIRQPLPKFILPGHLISRPVDFIVSIVYLITFFLFVRLYRSNNKYHTPFEYSMIASLIFGFAAQIYMVHSQKLYDAQFDMSHLAKIVSYIFPIFGIGAGIFAMYKKQEEANIVLELRIAERKKAEEEIRKSRATLQTIIDSMPFGVMVVGKDKKIRQINAAAQQLSGYSENELVGQLCHKTLCPAEENNCPILDQKQVVDNSERKLTTKDGREIPIIKSVVPLKIGDEDALLEAFIDIAERKEAERKLGEVNKDLEDTVSKLGAANDGLESFVNIASHDLREPLRKIISFASILKKSLQGKISSDDAENLAFVIEGTNRMTQIVGGLLAYLRIIVKTQSAENVDINKIAAQLEQFELAVILKEKNATIEIPSSLPVVKADSAQIRQLFLHLIVNGIKYQKKDSIPKITITSKPAAGGMVRIEVTDNGIGIKPEYHQAIFNMFKQLHSHGEYEGAGVGLTVCKKIVELHGGEIGVESQTDKGSTFWFTMPAAEKLTIAATEVESHV